MNDIELALLIDRLMRRIHCSLQGKAPNFDREKIGPGGGIILLTLAEMGSAALSELTRRVGRDKSQMTRTIRALEAKGLVARATCPTDTRISIISLTQAGYAMVDVIAQALAETIGEIMAPIGDDEKEQLKKLLKRLF